MKRYGVLIASLLLSIGCVAASAQSGSQSSTAQSSTPVLHTSAQDVVLDMIFRNKQGKPIDNIQQSQVHVYQNGVEQKLDSFTLVHNAHNPALGNVAQYDPMQQLRTVTLVFEGLNPEGKRFFSQALHDILQQAPEKNLYFSVYVVDQYLHVIQPFTNNHQQLEKAVKRSLAWSYIDYTKNSNQIQASLNHIVSQGQPTLQSNGNAGPSTSSINDYVQYQMAKLQSNLLQEAAAGDREYGARGDMDALMELVQSEARLPGHKVILYFNPNLQVTETVKEQFHHMVKEANRGNVSFYTVDPKGLVTYSQTGSGEGQLSNALGAVRGSQMNGGAGEVSTSQAQAENNAIAAVRSDPELWLRALANETGGRAIINSNNLNKPMQMVMNEVGTYYEASYNPHITAYNGKFQKISVKVDRPGINVITRTGYYALPTIHGKTLEGFELPMLNAMNAATPPKDIPFDAGAERFNERGPNIQYMLVVDIPMSNLTFTPEADKVHALLNTAMMAVVKNSAGDIVQKFSRNFDIQVLANDINRYKAGQLVRTFETSLAPGTYTLETAIIDRNANKTSVEKSTFTVPKPTKQLAISDPVVVMRKEALKNNKIEDPFYYPGGKVVPTLDTTLHGGKGNYLPFYFAVYPDPSVKAQPKLTMAFYRGGQLLGAAPVQLPPVNKNGRIPYIAAIPAASFQPGSYEIKFQVKQGGDTVENQVHFQIK